MLELNTAQQNTSMLGWCNWYCFRHCTVHNAIDALTEILTKDEPWWSDPIDSLQCVSRYHEIRLPHTPKRVSHRTVVARVRKPINTAEPVVTE